MSTHWRARVVSSAATIVLLCSQFFAFSQDLKSTRVTYSCNTDLETVIHHLSQQTGAFFIYSGDKIKTNITVSLSVKEQSLHDVLTLLGQRLNLQFKIQGNYVTIKPLDCVAIKPTELTASRKPSPAVSELPPATNVTTNLPARKFLQPALPNTSELTSDYLAKELPKLSSYFDASLLQQLPLTELRKLNTNNRHQGWFMSAGVLINDYSKGFELQAGIRSAYAVFAPSWLPSGTFHGAFGLGTAFQLNRNLSINTIYTYSKLSEKKTVYNTEVGTGPPKFFKVSGTIHHQQLKAMLQWAPDQNIVLKFGPSLNYAKTTYNYEFPKRVTIVHVRSNYGEPPPPGSTQFHQTLPPPRPVDPTSVTNRVWLGWEASVSYKINFFKKP